MADNSDGLEYGEWAGMVKGEREREKEGEGEKWSSVGSQRFPLEESEESERRKRETFPLSLFL